MHRIFTLLLASLLFVGCSPSVMVKKDPASYLYLPPIGTTIELEQSVSVPPGNTRVFLQRGKVVSKQAFDRYVPSCNFEIRTLSEQEQKISPETFLVTRVQQETSEVVQLALPNQLAGLYLAGMDSGQPMVLRSVHLWFISDLQPDLMRLTCRGALDDMSSAYPPSIEEMRESMGTFARIVLP